MPGSDPVNILVVDDDRSVQRVLADTLTKNGFVVTVERDGAWAVKTFEKKTFDVVLLDLLLPGLSGYEVAAQIRALTKGRHVPIVMISGIYKGPSHSKEAIQKYGAVALLEKPLDLQLVLDTLKSALGSAYPSPVAATPPPPPLEEDHVTGEILADETQREEVVAVESNVLLTTIDSTSQPTEPHALWGNFSQTAFASILAEAYRSRFNGAIRLRRRDVKKIVYFRDGTPELVKSNLLVECLGRVLVRERLISVAECEESLRRMRLSKRFQGTVLIEMGCLSPHNLQHSLSLQLQHKMYDVFSWDEGEYQLVPGAPLPAETVSIGLTCAQLISDAVKRTYDAVRLAKVFFGHDFEYVHPSAEPLYALQDVGLIQEEEELLKLADGHKTLATLRALEILPPFETDRFFFAMACAQMIAFKISPAPGKPHHSLPEMPRLEGRPPPLPSRPPPPLKSSKTPPPLVAKSVSPLLPEFSEVVSLPLLSIREGVQRETLAATLTSMRRKNYFEVLGVTPSATREEIKRAFFSLAKAYHPDKHLASSSAETRALSQHIYDFISTAHDTLTQPGERASYLASLSTENRRAEDADVGKVLAAEGKFQRGEEMMQQHLFAEAVKLFNEAIALYPDEGEFHAWHGWALFQAFPDRVEDALRALETAVSLNPKLDQSYLFLGYIYKAIGRPDRAERQFEKAIQCNPACTEALHELRLFGKQRR